MYFLIDRNTHCKLYLSLLKSTDKYRRLNSVLMTTGYSRGMYAWIVYILHGQAVQPDGRKKGVYGLVSCKVYT